MHMHDLVNGAQCKTDRQPQGIVSHMNQTEKV